MLRDLRNIEFDSHEGQTVGFLIGYQHRAALNFLSKELKSFN